MKPVLVKKTPESSVSLQIMSPEDHWIPRPLLKLTICDSNEYLAATFTQQQIEELMEHLAATLEEVTAINRAIDQAHQ